MGYIAFKCKQMFVIFKKIGRRSWTNGKIGYLRKGGFIRISAAGKNREGLRGAYQKQGVFILRLSLGDRSSDGIYRGGDHSKKSHRGFEGKGGARFGKTLDGGKVPVGTSLFRKEEGAGGIL